MPNQELKKLLLIEDDAADAEIAQRFLALAARDIFQLRHVATLTEATAQLNNAPFDAILLDLNLPDSTEETTFSMVRDLAQATPIIVLTGLGNEEQGLRLVRDGAQDYLVKGRFDAFLLARVLRYALERAELQRQRDHAQEEVRQAGDMARRERELRLLAETDQGAALEDGDAAKSGGRIATTAPAYFATLVEQYSLLLDLALNRRIYKSDRNTLGEPLRHLAAELCHRRVTPKDLVEMHGAALEAKMLEASQPRNQLLVEEGRLLLVELMGYIIAAYRSAGKRPPTRAEAEG